MEKKMSRWGIGPTFAFSAMAFELMTLVIHYYFYPFFCMDFVPCKILIILGIIFIASGLLFFVMAVKKVMPAYKSDRLVTDGIYSFCRHPVYASGMFCVSPGIVFLTNSWLGFSTILFEYLIFIQLIKKEEQYLDSTFGPLYNDYKKKVPCVLPFKHIKPV